MLLVSAPWQVLRSRGFSEGAVLMRLMRWYFISFASGMPCFLLLFRCIAMHTYLAAVLFITTFKRATKQSLPQQPTNYMRSNGYHQYKKITYSPVEGVLRHYSRRFYIAICKRSEVVRTTVVESAECEARSPLFDDAASFDLPFPRPGRAKIFWYFSFSRKVRKNASPLTQEVFQPQTAAKKEQTADLYYVSGLKQPPGCLKCSKKSFGFFVPLLRIANCTLRIKKSLRDFSQYAFPQ